MKIRAGFVSNSSASSFCIYGWVGKYQEMTLLEEKIKAAFPDIKLIRAGHPYSDTIVGVGQFEDEVDHWYGENWEDYECDGPSKEEMEALDKIANTLELPAPMMDNATWFNG